MAEIKLTPSDYDSCTIRRIIERYAAIQVVHPADHDLYMAGLTVIHLNCVPLNLDWLLNHGSDYDIVHDVEGCARWVNMATGQIKGMFWPHAAKRGRVETFSTVRFTTD